MRCAYMYVCERTCVYGFLRVWQYAIHNVRAFSCVHSCAHDCVCMRVCVYGNVSMYA